MYFAKMHGTGNDFIVLEDFCQNLYKSQYSLAKKFCDRRFGIGADGILIVRNSEKADIKMEIINADGSYAAMCGNGIRCFAKYVYDAGIVKNNTIKIETGDGIKVANLNIIDGKVEEITINMGSYSLEPLDIPLSIDDKIINKDILVEGKKYNMTSMKMGVPHTVVMGELNKVDVLEGMSIEKYNLFPEGTNVNFCEVLNRKNIKVKTWERGAGPTLACGTGSCASVIASNLLGYTDKKVKVFVPGGELKIQILNKDVLMTGPAVTVFKGEIIY